MKQLKLFFSGPQILPRTVAATVPVPVELQQSLSAHWNPEDLRIPMVCGTRLYDQFERSHFRYIC